MSATNESIDPLPDSPPTTPRSLEPVFEDARGVPARDVEIAASLGEGVRQVTRLIEEVGRTLEAQNQRSLRLMERLERLATVMETIPEEGDRNLEALDALEKAVERQQAPLEKASERLAALPEVVRAVREGNQATRELWVEATRALSARLALQAAQAEERMRSREAAADRRQRRRLAALATVALVALGGGGAATVLGARAAVRDALARFAGVERPVDAAEGEASWRVIRIGPREAIDEAAPRADPPTTIVRPAETVPSGTVRTTAVEGLPGALAAEGAEPQPRVQGSLVIEDVGPKPKTELVPSLIQPMN